MSTSSELVQEAVSLAMEGRKTRKQGKTWYFDHPEVITLLNTQKSQWGEQYYVNLGVWLKELGDARSPKENQCHIRARLSSVAGNSIPELDRALNLEDSSMSDERRREIILSATREVALPFLDSLSTMAGIREAHVTGRLGGTFVAKRAVELAESRTHE